MNKKLRVGIDNITQDLKDLTLPTARHTFIGLIAIAVTTYINALAIALPFCLSFIIGKTGPLLLLIATPIICAISTFLLSLILSKNKPKEVKTIDFSHEAYILLKEVLYNGVAYKPTRPDNGNFRDTDISRGYATRNTEDFSRESPYPQRGFSENARFEEYRQGSSFSDTEHGRAGNSRADSRNAEEVTQRVEAMRKPNPYAYSECDCPSEEEVRSFYRRDDRSRPSSEPDPRASVGHIGPVGGDERISEQERESFTEPAEHAGYDSSREQN